MASSRVAIFRRRMLICILLLGSYCFAAAQTLITTVTAGSGPAAVAVNATTNKAYVANHNSNNLTVIDGVTYGTTTVLTGAAPDAVAINPVTNKIYVVNANGNSVTVVDGATNHTTTVSVGSYPVAAAVNTVSNKIYVANYYANTVTVIDGATNRTTTVTTARRPYALAVNAATNKIYVADSGSSQVTVIDGATNSTTPVTVGTTPHAIAVDPYSNQIYVANYDSNSVSAIDGATNHVTSVSVGTSPAALAINPMRCQVYVVDNGSDDVTIIDETTLATTTVAAGNVPSAIDIDPVGNKAYVTDPAWNGTVTMIDGNDDSTSSVSGGIYPTALAFNPVTRTVWVADSVGNSVSVIAGAGSDPLQFVAAMPCRIADTRQQNGPFGGPSLGAGQTRSFAIPQSSCNIPAAALAYSLNITVVPVNRHPLGYLTVWPTGEAMPAVSTLNSDGRVKANATIVPAGAGGAVSVYATDATDVLLDINGYFQASGGGLQFYSLPPCRVLDTRNSQGNLGGPPLSSGQERDFPVLASDCQIPASAQAYSLNFTVVPVRGRPLGYLTVWPAGQPQPVVSTLNNPTATVVANAAIVPAGAGGAIATYADQDTQLIADVNGYFAAPASGGLSLYPVSPCRVIDTRSSGGAFNGQRNPPVNVTGSPCNVPGAARQYVFNATVVPAGSLGYLTLWAHGDTMPVVSTLNAPDGTVTSNMAIVGQHSGKVDAYAAGTTNLILDISSYFGP